VLLGDRRDDPLAHQVAAHRGQRPTGPRLCEIAGTGKGDAAVRDATREHVKRCAGRASLDAAQYGQASARPGVNRRVRGSAVGGAGRWRPC
jgi:hypothetical protein